MVSRLRVRRPDTCAVCKKSISVGTLVFYDRTLKTVICLTHETADDQLKQVPIILQKPLLGTPGGSARKMDEKRKHRKGVEDERIKEQYRAEHPKFTRVMKSTEKNYPRLIAWMRRELNSSNEPSSWSKGAEGEEIVGRILEELSQRNGFITIHDRLVPGSVANIDHIVVTSSKVFVVDAKKYAGKIEFGKLLAPYFGGKAILKVNGRNRNKLLEDVEKQVRIVEQLLAKAGIDIPVQGVLAFVKAKWEKTFFPRPKSINGVLLNSRGLHSIFQSVPPVDREIVLKIAKQLLEDLPSAS